MRRLLAIGLLASLAVTGIARAATPLDGPFRAEKGKVEKGYELSFEVSGGGTRVGQLRARLLQTCEGAGSSAMATVTSMAAWTVRGGKFAARKKETRGSATVFTTFEGRFTSRIRASGSVRQVTFLAGKRCDTYKVPFAARRR
jgi:hypothetical protein